MRRTFRNEWRAELLQTRHDGIESRPVVAGEVSRGLEIAANDPFLQRRVETAIRLSPALDECRITHDTIPQRDWRLRRQAALLMTAIEKEGFIRGDRLEAPTTHSQAKVEIDIFRNSYFPIAPNGEKRGAPKQLGARGEESPRGQERRNPGTYIAVDELRHNRRQSFHPLAEVLPTGKNHTNVIASTLRDAKLAADLPAVNEIIAVQQLKPVAASKIDPAIPGIGRPLFPFAHDACRDASAFQDLYRCPRGPIAGAIVYDNDFHQTVIKILFQHRAERLADPFFAIIRGDDHADGRSRSCAGDRPAAHDEIARRIAPKERREKRIFGSSIISATNWNARRVRGAPPFMIASTRSHQR